MSKILVVDDNATNRKLLITWLNFEGYLTVEAADGSDGLAAVRRERPNVVISDILMPTILRLLHCDQMQGYLVSQPLSFEDMTAFIRQSPGALR